MYSVDRMTLYDIVFALLVLILILFATGSMSLIKLYMQANDFPHRRNFCKSERKLNGKTAIVTGGNSGIGYETAKDLARRGAHVILGCRNMDRGNKAKQQIIDDTGNNTITVIQLDLSDLESVTSFADHVTTTETELHLIINNAGIADAAPHSTTKQGFDVVFGTNHLGHFLLTYLMLDLLRAGAPSRVVNVSSISYLKARSMDFTKQNSDGKTYPRLKGYAVSKLANILHAKELARRFQDVGIKAYSLHPGFVKTNLFTTVKEVMPKLFGLVVDLAIRNLALDARTGAQCTLYCALEESLDTPSGGYYENCKEVCPQGDLANDEILATQLWEESVKMVGISQQQLLRNY